MITIRKNGIAMSRRARRCSTVRSATAASSKTVERLREGRLPADGLSPSWRRRTARVVGTVRLWNVAAGAGRPALLLGPLAVDPDRRSRGLGGALMRRALARRASGSATAPSAGRRCALLRALRLLGRADRRPVAARPATSATASSRCELAPGALDGARGTRRATGRRPKRRRARRRLSANSAHDSRGRRAQIRARA